jgi:hypothetical protein
MPYDFPNAPTVGTTAVMTDGSQRTWDGVKWKPGPGTGSYGIADAPSDGSYYARQNASWQKALALVGGTMLGAINMGSFKITALANGSAASDAAAFGQIPLASITTPLMDGTAAIGSGTTWAKADHIHPSDTSRVPVGQGLPTGGAAGQVLAKNTATSYDVGWVAQSGGITDAPSDGSSYGRLNAAWAKVLALAGGTMAGAIAMGNNKITGLANGTLATDAAAFGQIPAVPAASSTTPAMDGTAAIGVGTTYARADHVHPSDTSRVAIAGSTMTGLLVLSANPAVALGAAPKQYVDAYFPVSVANAGVPTGGTVGQVLSKNSGTNYDVAWATPAGGVSGLAASQLLFGSSGGTIQQDASLIWDTSFSLTKILRIGASPAIARILKDPLTTSPALVEFTANLHPDPSDNTGNNWLLDDTTRAGWMLGFDVANNSFAISQTPAHANPITPAMWANPLVVTPTALNSYVPYQYKGINFTQIGTRRGTGTADYTTTSTSWVWVDATNLRITVTIPTGFVALCWASGMIQTSNSGVAVGVTIAKDAPATLVGAYKTTVSLSAVSWSDMAVVTGDGASHQIGLAFFSGGGGASAIISNGNVSVTPELIIVLIPSFQTL